MISIILLLAGSSASAETRGGVTAMPVLRVPMGPAAMGMAGAFTAVDGILDARWYNPAALGSIRHMEAGAAGSKGLEDTSFFEGAAVAPLPWTFLSERYPVVAAVGLFHAGAGSLDWRRTNPDGSFLSESKISAGKDLQVSVSLSQRIFDEPRWREGRPENWEHYVGVTGKFLDSTLAERYSAQAWAGDLGYLLKLPAYGLAFGASVLNLGSSVRYIEESDPLPTSFRAGVAWQGGQIRSGGKPIPLTIAADTQHFIEEKQTFYALGFELKVTPAFRFRTGYRFGADSGGFTAGFGLAAGPRFTMDYAWVPNGLFGDSHRLGFRAYFEAPWRVAAEPDPARLRRTFETPSLEQLQQRQEPSKPATPAKPAPRQGDPMLIPGWIR